MVAPRARFCCVLVASASLLVARASSAQLHWDASAQVGVMKRVLVDRPEGGPDATVGPVGQVAGHVALLPLVRLGGYFGHDISPMGGSVSARDVTSGGIRAKIMSPWPRGSVRTWIFVGFGYSGVYARSTPATRVQGAGGGFFDVPFGLGVSYSVRKPFSVCAELGMHAGFGHVGSAYEAPGPQVAGTDRFAIGLTVGVLLDL